MITEIVADQFDAEVRGSTVPVLLEFFTSDCAPCRQVLPILDEIAVERGAALKVLKFNAGDDPQFASQFRVRSVPNFVIFKAGEPMGQRTGFASKRDILA